MYLCDLNGDKIEVYSMIPNKAKIYKYKKEQMQVIPEYERVLKAVTNHSPEFLKGGNGDCHRDKNIYSRAKLFNRKFHDLQIYNRTKETIEAQNSLLEKYYNGLLENIKIKSIANFCDEKYWKDIKYVLLTERYIRDEKSGLKVMNNIIQLPESLYLLECILMGLPYDDDKTEEQVKLFDISKEPIEVFDWETFKRMDEIGLTSHSTVDIIEEVNKSQKVLRYIKK